MNKKIVLPQDHIFYRATSDIKELCRPLLKMDLQHFSFTRSYGDGRRIYFTTHPEFLSNYFHERFYAHGDCEFIPNSYNEQVLLWSTLPNQALYENARELGILDGIFMVRVKAQHTDFYNFASCTFENITNVVLSNFHVLHKFTHYFNEHVAQLVAEANQTPFILPHRNQKNHIQNTPTLDIDLILPSRKFLSKRQGECVQLLMAGYSSKKISQALRLSPRTIEDYVGAIKEKFSVKTKAQLMFKLAKYYD